MDTEMWVQKRRCMRSWGRHDKLERIWILLRHFLLSLCAPNNLLLLDNVLWNFYGVAQYIQLMLCVACVLMPHANGWLLSVFVCMRQAAYISQYKLHTFSRLMSNKIYSIMFFFFQQKNGCPSHDAGAAHTKMWNIWFVTFYVVLLHSSKRNMFS